MHNRHPPMLGAAICGTPACAALPVLTWRTRRARRPRRCPMTTRLPIWGSISGWEGSWRRGLGGAKQSCCCPQMFYDDLPIWGFIGKVENIMTQSSTAWEEPNRDVCCLQMFYDDLPIWGFIGKVEKIMTQSSKAWEKHDLKYYLFTHIHFDILYNGDRVIEANPLCPAPNQCRHPTPARHVNGPLGAVLL